MEVCVELRGCVDGWIDHDKHMFTEYGVRETCMYVCEWEYYLAEGMYVCAVDNKPA